jgi:hypothetical protein
MLAMLASSRVRDIERGLVLYAERMSDERWWPREIVRAKWRENELAVIDFDAPPPIDD